MAKSSAPLPPDAAGDFGKLIGTPRTQSDLQKVFVNSSEYSTEFINSLAKNATDSIEKMTNKSEALLKSVFSEIQSSAEKTAKGMKEDFKESFDSVASEAQKSTDKVIKQHERHKKATDSVKKEYKELKKTDLGGVIQSVVNNSIGKGAAEALNLSNVLGEVSGILIKMAPSLAAVGSVASAIGFFISRLVYWSDAMGKFQQLSGGNLEYWDGFRKQIVAIRRETNLDEDSIQQLAMSYYELGGNLQSTNKNLTGYLTTGSKVMNFFGTSAEDVAKFSRALNNMGFDTKQIDQTFNNLYSQMVDGHLTIADFNASIKEGYENWRSFGSVSGRTLDQFTSDMLGARNLFKGFNVDARTLQDSFSHLFGDRKSQLRSAGFIGNMMHMSAASAYMQKYKNPTAAIASQVMSAMTFLNRTTGGTAFMSGEELSSRFGDSKAAALMMQNQYMNDRAVQMANLSPEAFAQFKQSFMDAKKWNPGLTMEGWMKAGTNLKGPANAQFGKAYQAYLSTASQGAKSLENLAKSFFDDWSQVFLPDFEKVVSFLTGRNILDARRNQIITDAKASGGVITHSEGPLGLSPTHIMYPDTIKSLTKFPKDQQKILDLVAGAQYGLESGWGKHMPAGSNNPFGIKWSPKSGFPFVTANTWEVDKHGHSYRTTARFTKFPDLITSFRYHEKLLTNPHGPYAKALADLHAGNMEGFVRKMGHIYATDPHYADKILSILEKYGPLLEKMAITAEKDHNLNKQNALATPGTAQHTLLSNRSV
jgi:hypothetical protein